MTASINNPPYCSNKKPRRVRGFWVTSNEDALDYTNTGSLRTICVMVMMELARHRHNSFANRLSITRRSRVVNVSANRYNSRSLEEAWHRLSRCLTDFGTTDPYVGVMKGVMLGIAPDAQLIDLTHAIEPQNVKQAAFVLLKAFAISRPERSFWWWSIRVLGSSRKAIAVRSSGDAGKQGGGDYTFIAPDNGVLTYALNDTGLKKAFELTELAYRLSDTSSTFHGRDIFAPAAAHAAAGVALEQFGAAVDQPVRLPDPLLKIGDGLIKGEVLHIDHFGTAVTSIGLLYRIKPDHLTLAPRTFGSLAYGLSAAKAVVNVADLRLSGIKHTYAEVPRGEALALIGSSGYLELSINQGSFAAQFGVHIGDVVEVQLG